MTWTLHKDPTKSAIWPEPLRQRNEFLTVPVYVENEGGTRLGSYGFMRRVFYLLYCEKDLVISFMLPNYFVGGGEDDELGRFGPYHSIFILDDQSTIPPLSKERADAALDAITDVNLITMILTSAPIVRDQETPIERLVVVPQSKKKIYSRVR